MKRNNFVNASLALRAIFVPARARMAITATSVQVSAVALIQATVIRKRGIVWTVLLGLVAPLVPSRVQLVTLDPIAYSSAAVVTGPFVTIARVHAHAWWGGWGWTAALKRSSAMLKYG